jgi:gamma-glutamyl:cysteine ligase YbdK (ATP-grasp superfamily)
VNTLGTEHEYSVNDEDFKPLPIVDNIIQKINGGLVNEFQFGDVHISKELQKHVIEIVPHAPHTNIFTMEQTLFSGLQRLYTGMGNYSLLGLGMHPLLRLQDTTFWDHEDKEIYEEYDRVFSILQHGWLNIQALQINTPYESDQELIAKFNKLRSLVPFLISVAASSPFVEGQKNGVVDNRLVYYRENQKKIPLICHSIIPEKITSVKEHDAILEQIYAELRKEGAELLCHEWIDSRGVIVRPNRRCIEIKALDEQESIHSDMAMTAFTLALLRSNVKLEDDHQALLDLTETAIQSGTRKLRHELLDLYDLAVKNATKDERRVLPLVRIRIENGSLAELLQSRVQSQKDLRTILSDLERCLRSNASYA